MGEKKLEVKLALKGGTYQQQVNSIVKDTKLLESNFQKAAAGSKDFDKTLEGQVARLKLISGQYENSRKKLDVYSTQLKKCESVLDDATKAFSEQEKEVQSLKAQIDDYTKAYGPTSDAVKKLEKELSASEKALESKRKAVINADNSLVNIKTTINKTEAESQKFKTELNELSQEIKGAGSTAEEASDGLNKMSDSMEDATNKAEETGARLSLIGQGMQDIGDKASDTGKAMLGVVGDLTKAGSEYSAEVAGTDFLMKNLDKTVQEAIVSNSKLAKDIGLTEKQYKDSAVSIATYYKNMGFTAEESVNLSDKTMNLVADLAAVTDMPFDDAMGRFKSGLMGNYEALDAFGINLSASTLENSEFVQSLGKSWNKLSDNEKMMAAYNEIVRQGSSASGLAAQEAEEFGMKSKYLNERIDEVKGTIGEKLLPVLEPLIEKIVNVIEKVGEWIEKNPELTRLILIIVGALGALLAIIGPIISTIGTLTIAMGAFNVATLPITGTILLVIGVIAALIAIGVALIDKWDDITACWSNFVTWADNLWTNFKTDTIEKFIEIKDKISSSILQVRDNIVNKFNEIKSNVSNTIDNILSKITNWTSNVKNTVKTAFSNVYDFITSPFRRAWNFISGIEDKIVGTISKLNPFRSLSEVEETPVTYDRFDGIAKSGSYYNANTYSSRGLNDLYKATNNLNSSMNKQNINFNFDTDGFGNKLVDAIITGLSNVIMEVELTNEIDGEALISKTTKGVISQLPKIRSNRKVLNGGGFRRV